MERPRRQFLKKLAIGGVALGAAGIGYETYFANSSDEPFKKGEFVSPEKLILNDTPDYKDKAMRHGNRYPEIVMNISPSGSVEEIDASTAYPISKDKLKALNLEAVAVTENFNSKNNTSEGINLILQFYDNQTTYFGPAFKQDNTPYPGFLLMYDQNGAESNFIRGQRAAMEPTGFDFINPDESKDKTKPLRAVMINFARSLGDFSEGTELVFLLNKDFISNTPNKPAQNKPEFVPFKFRIHHEDDSPKKRATGRQSHYIKVPQEA